MILCERAQGSGVREHVQLLCPCVLEEEGGKLGLRHDRQLGVGAADVTLPVWVLRDVGGWSSFELSWTGGLRIGANERRGE